MTPDDEWIDDNVADLLDQQASDGGSATARVAKPPLARSRDDAENTYAQEAKKQYESWMNQKVYKQPMSASWGQPDNRPPYEQRSYPDAQQSLEDARKYGAYAEPSEAYINQKAKIRSPSLERAWPAVRKSEPIKETSSVDIETAAQMAQAREAANKSALAKLGFDPGNVVVSKDHPLLRAPATGMHIPYNPDNPVNTDRIWYDQSDPSAVTHEAVHRGISKLIRDGKTPEYLSKPPYGMSPHEYNELLTRAVMQRFFGSTENDHPRSHMGQINTARSVVPKQHIDELELLAQKLVAKHGKTAK